MSDEKIIMGLTWYYGTPKKDGRYLVATLDDIDPSMTRVYVAHYDVSYGWVSAGPFPGPIYAYAFITPPPVSPV